MDAVTPPAVPEAPHPLNPADLRVVLVLQGGGALGAYQAGVYEALYDAGLAPDWVVGSSIGAINAAIIAGNDGADRLAHLRQFWELVAHDDQFDMQSATDVVRRANILYNTTDTVLRGVPGFFTPRWFSGFPYGMPVQATEASFYDTLPLEDTLRRLVDFDYLNAPGGTRLTMDAVNVTTGELVHFDNRQTRLCAQHVRASGSLPPGFAPVAIDGDLYWDGSLYSNTPLTSVLNDRSPQNTLCFMVDLWSASGAAPQTLDEVRTRVKDLMFASRSQRHIADFVRTRRMQIKLRDLLARLPVEARQALDAAELEALGCSDSVMHIVRMPYAGTDWHMAAKDINFSRGSIRWRWEQGRADGQRAIDHAGWLGATTAGESVVMHELPSHDAGVRQAD